ncbi:uncharacterized protein A4U43_C03F11400 [Asparagus officinalis]|uniref:SBP-type domain-containing protein n=1 Tax=Asparagus officinalis TaxID=4686 RepID=A0A5P1FAZ3_ASPOF|nr:squamosa promoter-binding protein 1 [Asparagus officinalis]ONK74913.1 uncharacterized protein A4U43_C03F11400 [Asparagus officinalis]
MDRAREPIEPKQTGKARLSMAVDDDEEEEQISQDVDKRRRSVSSPTPSSVVARRPAVAGGVACQAEKCPADLTGAKRYHRRHKVCEAHSKAPVVMVAGLRQRFCQQCSRFHELSEFDETKRSCRRRLAGHNERRRKSSAESQGEGSSHCRQADQGGTIQISVPGSPSYKHFQIR